MTLNPNPNPNPKCKIKSLKPKKRENKMDMTHRCAVTIFQKKYFSTKITKTKMAARTHSPYEGTLEEK
jgi:hypothetical protein